MVERLNIADKLSIQIELMQKDLQENTEFRIKWPRGQLGALPADSEQFMMIEDLYKTTDKLKRTHRVYGIKQSQHRIFKKTNGQSFD